MYLVISTSLNPASRSFQLARQTLEFLETRRRPCDFIDLREWPLPLCDGLHCYNDPNVRSLADRIRAARGVLLASPIYNYDVSSAAKNLVEVTSKAWQHKVVAFVVSAGGQGSWMSVMGLANSLMLDFRCVIVPRFVYATEAMVTPEGISDPGLGGRLNELSADLVRIGDALASAAPGAF